jgi:hypothetical protein
MSVKTNFKDSKKRIPINEWSTDNESKRSRQVNIPLIYLHKTNNKTAFIKNLLVFIV